MVSLTMSIVIRWRDDVVAMVSGGWESPRPQELRSLPGRKSQQVKQSGPYVAEKSVGSATMDDGYTTVWHG